ncbi:acetyltransferase [Reticulomyxa filosa]|uniref:Acetyltransferase n=1 Tax=Reticulomyxa filosa TaxID=46433 RepID=X6M1M3_RETFI|nr:acetyltransferase [Reticulomyxa filosa]|eukprot:ETO07501.1 acetyltransferase [Reticulomyxa filosa]
MQSHIDGGKTLCIHSVVIDKKYRRHKFGTQLLKKYLQTMHPKLEKDELSTIKLLAKKYLIPFYQKVGFVLKGQSRVKHGKDTWYEMAYT